MFRWINGGDPRHYGWDFGLWKRVVAVELIEKKFGMALEPTLQFLPGYVADLNPGARLLRHVKRTGTARRPLQKGEKLRDKIERQLAKPRKVPELVRSVFIAPSVVYVSDCWGTNASHCSACRLTRLNYQLIHIISLKDVC